MITTASGLQYEDLTEGTGAVAKAGDSVQVHYTGWLTNGTKFDSSLDRGNPFTFKLGAGKVIKGWDEGVAGMKIGGKRKLHIPRNSVTVRGAGGHSTQLRVNLRRGTAGDSLRTSGRQARHGLSARQRNLLFHPRWHPTRPSMDSGRWLALTWMRRTPA